MHSVAVVLARLLLLVSLARFGECQLVSWLSDTTNETLASFVTLAGNLSIDSVFQLKNDLPEQHAALKVLYEATGGPNWSSTYSSDVNLEGLAQYAAAVGTGTMYIDFAVLATVLTYKVPWFYPNYSYCRWWGVTCCLTASESVLPTCQGGFQSVGQISLLGANLNGSLPQEIFDDLPDLSLLFLGQNPDLRGQISDVPVGITANMLIMNLISTSLQNKCATPSANGRNATWNVNECFGNMFVADLMSITSVANKPGLSCPSISVQRPSWLSPLTTAYNFQYVYAEPALVSYFNCTCAAPLRAHYFVDSKGLFQAECIADNSNHRVIEVVVPVGSLAVVLICVLGLLLAYRTRLQQEWRTMRINNLKRRHAPGTLMDRNIKGMDVFHKGMSIVMTDVEGSTALWEWNSRVMNSALALHDHTLRSWLPRYFGYEVTTEGDAFVVAFHDPLDAIGWTLHVQLALLEAPWPQDLLQHPQAKVDVCPEGKLLFRGLRVRMAINTGVPAEIIVHNVTKQVEYRGDMVELTEALTHLPAGGQVVLSDVTYHRIKDRLLEVQLPAFTFQCARSSLEAITDRTLSKFVEQSTPSAAGTPSSADGLLQGQASPEFAPHSNAIPKGRDELQHAKRAPWFTFKQAGGSLSVHTTSKHDLHIDVPAEDASPSQLTGHAMPRQSNSASAETTALASEQHSTCTIIDMGNYLLSACRNRPYTAADAALPPIAGEHVVQVLPQALVERAVLFPAMDIARQVAPSLFDAPGAQSAGRLNAVKPKQVGATMALDQPELAFACVSEFGYKEAASIDKQLASVALGQFKSCLRTTLLLCDGYECQETEGIFLIAFNSPRAALEWAVSLQLALLRVHWSESLLSLAPTHEELSSTGQVLFRGLSAKIGIFHGTIARLSPHATTGRAEYRSMALDRALRLWTACNAGQILVEKSVSDAVGLEWRGIQGTALPSELPSHLALRNHALLMHRVHSELAAFKLASTTTSISGVIGRHMIGTMRQPTMPKLGKGLSLRHLSSCSGSLTPRTLSRQTSRLGDAGPNVHSTGAASLAGTLARPLSRQFTAGGHEVTKPRRTSMLQHTRTGAAAELQSYASEYEEWTQSGETPAETPSTSAWSPKIAKLLSGKWYSNQAYRLTESLSRGNSMQLADVAESQATSQTPLTAPTGASDVILETNQVEASPEDATLPSHTPPTSVDGHPIGTPYNGTTGVVPSGPPATPAGQLPVCPVTVQIHHMGQYSFKGTPDKFELCQAMPASLSERRASYLDVAVNSNGKLLCIRKDDSMALSVSVMLPDILHLPLAAEPPLYLNVLQAHTHSSKTVI